MYIRSISPIVATILIIVMTVAIAGIFYAFTTGIFNPLTQSSSQQVQQQSQVTSFTISDVYCSNNIVYFDIYNNGNIPININNSEVIFTDNNGNTISINGNNIMCNNGNIIPIGSNSLCYVENYICSYSYTDYMESMNFVFNGISYNYNIPNNKFIIHSPFYSITIYNTQSQAIYAPFQQDIAICNGNINIGNSFAYVNNPTLFYEIDSDGQNVYFTTNYNSTPNIYSWYEGQLNYNGVTCDVWWINVSQEIPANSNITIYMNVGPNNANYYSQYYPYVGEAPQLSSTYGQYDNGQYVFLFYDNFAGTSLNTSKWNANSYGYYSVNNGLTIYPAQETCSASPGEITSIQTFGINTIFEFYGIPAFAGGTAWAYGSYGYNPGDAGCITLYGDIVGDANTGTSNVYIWTGTASSSNKVQTSFTQTIGIYSVIQAPSNVIAMFNYSFTASTTSNIGSNSYPVGFYVGGGMSENAIIYWTRVRAYPPNGIMPSIYIS